MISMKHTVIAAKPATRTKPAPAKIGSNSKKALADIVKSINSRDNDHYLGHGRDLIEAKVLVGHGKFGNWVKDNFDWLSPSSALNYMRAAELVGENVRFADLPSSAVIDLARPSTPKTVIAEVLANLDAGKKPTVAEIKTKIKAAKTPKPTKEADTEDAADAGDDAAPVPAAGAHKSQYQELLDLLKRVGMDVATQAITEAFAPEEGKPTPVPVQPPALLADNDLSDEELEELDLGQAA